MVSALIRTMDNEQDIEREQRAIPDLPRYPDRRREMMGDREQAGTGDVPPNHGQRIRAVPPRDDDSPGEKIIRQNTDTTGQRMREASKAARAKG